MYFDLFTYGRAKDVCHLAHLISLFILMSGCHVFLVSCPLILLLFLVLTCPWIKNLGLSYISVLC